MAGKYDKILGVYRDKDAGVPGGSDTQIQYNNAGAFGGNANLTYDSTNNQVAIGTTPTTNLRNGLFIYDGGIGIKGRIDETTTDIRFSMGLGPAADSARILFGHPTLNWEIDNDGTGLRIFTPGTIQYLFSTSTLDLRNGKAIINAGSIGYNGGITQTGTTANTFTANTTVNKTLTVGLAGTQTGQIDMRGTTSGVVSVLPQATAGTYNFNLPTTAGSSGDVLTSAAGGSSPMTWSSPGALGVRWSSLVNPTGNLSLTMGTNTSTMNYATGTSTNNLFNFTTDASANGTGYLVNVATGASSTVKPLRVNAAGTDIITVSAAGAVAVAGATTFTADVTHSAVNIVTDTTTGMKIGTATSQKIGFYNSTPIIQPVATTDLGTALSNLGLRAAGTAYPVTTSGTVTLSGTVALTGNGMTADNLIWNNNAITASGNAATVPVTFRHSTVTNNSAATLTITITTTSAVDGQMLLIRIKDFSAVAQTITWVNTENSTVSAPTTSNGSTTLPLTVGFQYNSATTKWRCIASA